MTVEKPGSDREGRSLTPEERARNLVGHECYCEDMGQGVCVYCAALHHVRDAEQAVVRRVLEIADRHPWADFRREVLAAFPEPPAKPKEEA